MHFHEDSTDVISERSLGQFKDGKKHGRGTYNLANGIKYVGDWVEDTMEGEGVKTWSTGYKYKGTLRRREHERVGRNALFISCH